MKDQPLILVTNDDGIYSPGLLALAQDLGELGELLIVAPRSQRSGWGRGLAGIEGSAEEEELGISLPSARAYALESSPAWAVRYAIVRLADRRPVLVISGINYGENLGTAISVSGTVGAAMEGAAHGIPSLAVSLETEQRYHLSHSTEVDFSVAARFARRMASGLVREGLPSGVDLLKVDVPRRATRDTGWRMTRASRQRYFWPTEDLGYEARVDLESLEPDSDIQAVTVDGVISVTPLTLDLTADVDLVSLESLLA
ncbi:MAG: 5'/3'-nucleotidase SurE [Anaerolineae bacterium]